MKTILRFMNRIKIPLIFILFSAASHFSLAQIPDHLWAVEAGGTGYDASRNLVIDNQGNTIITGYFDSTITIGSTSLVSAGSADIFIIKYDPNGNLIWARRAGGVDYDEAYSVAVDNSNNIIITGFFTRSIIFGSTTLPGGGGTDIFIAKYSPGGIPIWAVGAGGQSDDVGYDVITDNLDNIIITGYFQSFATFEETNITGNSFYDFYTAKYNSQGNLQWVRSAGGESTSFNYYQGYGLAVDAQDNIYITGTFSETMSFIAGNSSDDLISAGGNDIFIARYSPTGNFIWAKRAGGENYDVGNDIIVNKSNRILLTGTFGGLADFGNINIQSFGYSDIFIAEYSTLGGAIWVTHEGNTDSVDNYEGVKISLNELDEISLLGRVATSKEVDNIYVGRFTKVGDHIWSTLINSNTFYSGGGIGNSTNNDIIFSGVFEDNISLGNFEFTGFGNTDLFLTKLEFPKLIYDENPIDFEVVAVGDTVTRTAVFTNNSDVFLSTVSIGLSGPDIANYYIPIITQEIIIPPQESRSVNISFAPISSGKKDVYFIIRSGSISTPDTLFITGIGGVPPLQFVPDSLMFGDVTIGENLTKNLSLVNNSSVTVGVNNISVQGINAGDFAIISGLPLDSVPPLQSANLSIRFSPSASTDRNAILVLGTNAVSNPDTLLLAGTGKAALPEFTFSADTLNFGSVDIGNFSEISLTITRPQSSDLIINNFLFSGIDVNEFSVMNTSLPDTIKGTESKNYLIRFTPINSGNKNVLFKLSTNAETNPDSVFLIGTAISSITVQQANTANLGQNSNLNIIPPSGFTFTVADFFFRMTGETNYQQTNLIFADSFYIANIPAEFTTERGIQYYIVFSDGINTITFPTEDPINNPAAIQVRIPQYFYPINFINSVYQMITIPLEVSDPSIDSILVDDYGAYKSSQWRIFSWDSPTNSYLEYSSIISGLIPGKGFWLINKEGKLFDIENALSISASSPFLIRLQSGWNQIGSPFSFPVEWDSIQNSNLILNRPQRWNSTIENYEIDQQVLLPWEGYWVLNEGAPINLSVLPIEAVLPEKKNVFNNLKSDEFIIQIKALSSTNVQDPSNYIGMLNDAKNGYDKFDILEPPSISDKLRLSFFSEKNNYAKNIVSSSDEGAYWDIKITSSMADRNISLNLIKKSKLPAEFDIWLLDMDRMFMLPVINDKINLSLEENAAGNYRIIVGKESYAESHSENISLIPLEYSLFQNYPNPFNPSTIISYNLKEISSVKLDIFNLLGEKVITLINNENQNAGLHSITWNGENYSGGKMASGIYIYKITANEFRESKKMILIK